jgi:hypothetical protein
MSAAADGRTLVLAFGSGQQLAFRLADRITHADLASAALRERREAADERKGPSGVLGGLKDSQLVHLRGAHTRADEMSDYRGVAR